MLMFNPTSTTRHNVTNHTGRVISNLLLMLGMFAFIFLLSHARADDPNKDSATKAKREPIYNEKAGAKAQIAAAVKRAKHDNKRVMVMFGGNWCGWCYKLHDVFQKNEEIAPIIRGEYELVMIDIGTNQALLTGFGKDNDKHGVPFLTVLDGDGKVLTNQNTGDLEKGPEHDAQKVKAFLTKWTPAPRDAEEVLKNGLAAAKSEGKLVFLHLGAPACGWCRVLDRFLEQQESTLGKDYVDVKIDMTRMTNGESVAKRLRHGSEGGIPWFAILDAQGKELANSDGPQGNIGYPAKSHEIEHFMAVLQKTARHLSPTEATQIRQALETYAADHNLR